MQIGEKFKYQKAYNTKYTLSPPSLPPFLFSWGQHVLNSFSGFFGCLP